MLATLFTTLTLLAVGTHAALNLDTPDSVTQCGNVDITFKGDDGPFILAVVPGDDNCDDAFVEFPALTGTKYTWKVDQPEGTLVQFVIEDSKGNEAWSGKLTVKKGTDASCLSTEDQKPEAQPTGVKNIPPASGSSSAPAVKGTGAAAPPPPANAGSNPNDDSEAEPGANAASATRASLGVAVFAALLALAQL